MQRDSGLTSKTQSELSHLLADSIVHKTRFTQASHPDVLDLRNAVDTRSTTTKHLLDVLAQIWANELEDDSVAVLTGLVATRNDAGRSEVIPARVAPYSFPSRRELLPPKDRADQWLQTYLDGPNKFIRICSPKESQQLLNSLYNPQQEISPKSECLITWQLAIGARFTAQANEQTYTTIYESARIQTEICIEEDDDMLLWIVPTLLLRCVYFMNSQPRNCWLHLGESSIFARVTSEAKKSSVYSARDQNFSSTSH